MAAIRIAFVDKFSRWYVMIKEWPDADSKYDLSPAEARAMAQAMIEAADKVEASYNV